MGNILFDTTKKSKTNLKNMSISELEIFFDSIGEKKFRATQVFKWIYKGAKSFEEMRNLPKALIEKLNALSYISSLIIAKKQESKIDESRKYLFELEDGNRIESVFMKYKYGNTLCISSQAGCRMGCKFCASTLDGLKRNLTAGEMADQILAVQRDTKEKIGHIVVMGTGEPFDNYDELCKFIRLVNNPKGLNIGMRNITVSTCGLVPIISKFASDLPQVNLAISLHAPNDELRSSMMPINKRYDIATLISACKEYTNITNRRITFEYALVAGKNDSNETINELISLLRGMLCHINLIPLNEVKETGLFGSNRKRASEIAKMIDAATIPVTVRRELASDIDGACGQLRLSAKS